MKQTPTVRSKFTWPIPVVLGILCLANSVCAEVFDVTDPPFSAAGDGTADNRAALVRAFTALKPGDTLLIPPGDYRIVLTKGQLSVPDGVTLLGQHGRSRLLLISSGSPSEHREFLKLGSDVTLEGLTVERNGDFPLVTFPLFGDLKNIVFNHCTIIGRKSRFPQKYCHAIQVGVGKLKGLILRESEIRDCQYGLFQANEATGSLESVRVQRCLFEGNTASDLEFNSPKGRMQDIDVRDCVFRTNLCKTPSAGFAVGFANVRNGKVESCRIENYGSEALHVEDRSTDIFLGGNTIVGGSLLQPNGVIMVLSGARNVTIRDNVIDGRSNTNNPHLVLVTAGGGKFPNPSDVSVGSNILVNGRSTRTKYLQPGSGPAPVGNLVIPGETAQ